MNILNLSQTNYHIKFKSSIPEYEDDGVLGYSDLYSEGKRLEWRREDYPYTIPEINSYTYGGKPLSEEELAAMIANLAPKIKITDKVTILKLPNVKKALRQNNRCRKDLNIYQGPTLFDQPEEVYEIVKKAGVETVIDLVEFGDTYEEKVENAGFNYYCYPIGEYVLDDLRSKKERKDKLIEFIKEVQKDNIYMACSSGEDNTYIGLMLNSWFNPKFKLMRGMLNTRMREKNLTVMSFARSIYPYMTEEDKKAIGWTPEFEENFKENLNDSLRHHGYY